MELIKKGLAYVCELTPEEFKANRGDIGIPATSPYRDRPIEENLRLFEKMKNGEVESMKIWRELLGYVKLIVIVVAITLVINNVVLINAKIPSPSMEKTLMVKDRLFGFRFAYGINLNLFGYEISEKFKDPERFDIVIFKYPDDESRLFIKRVIGLPGEVVEIKDGKVYIDGSPTPLDDSFIPEKMIGSYGPYTVPENCYFMLGDNRNDSKDSRSWKNKFVRFDQIVGKAVVRYYPSFKWLG